MDTTLEEIVMKCDMCKNDFDVDKEPGSLLFSPPIQVDSLEDKFITFKSHLCVKCHGAVVEFIDNHEGEEP